jgi:chromosome segregation ATPase
MSIKLKKIEQIEQEMQSKRQELKEITRNIIDLEKVIASLEDKKSSIESSLFGLSLQLQHTNTFNKYPSVEELEKRAKKLFENSNKI